MRILLIDVNCKTSSTGQIVYNMYSYFKSRGDTVAVCYGRGKDIKENNIYKFGLDWETFIHAILTRLTGLTGCYSYFSTRRLIHYIEEFQPDVVHIHELHAYFVNTVSLLEYLAKKNIRVIHTLHCEYSYTGKCGHSYGCEGWKHGCGKCPNVRDYPTSLFFDRTKRMYASKKRAFSAIRDLTITAPSEWLANRAKESFFRERKILTVHNGVDTDVFFPRDTTQLRERYGISPNEKIVLALAPHLMSEGKGGQFVLELADKAGSKTRFILIGIDGETETLEGNKIRLGPIYDKDLLAQFYSLADVFVICSKRENYPTTCLEAQACGTPVCGFDTGGTKETCISQIEGQFVKYGDVDSLLTAINKMRKKPNRTSTWLENHAGKILGFSEMARKYRDLYSD